MFCFFFFFFCFPSLFIVLCKTKIASHFQHSCQRKNRKEKTQKRLTSFKTCAQCVRTQRHVQSWEALLCSSVAVLAWQPYTKKKRYYRWLQTQNNMPEGSTTKFQPTHPSVKRKSQKNETHDYLHSIFHQHA
uniref:Putative secreted protein n=1 Tax=Rhipicephalus microplus TaxID=6941 RepID=A0A6M2D9W9_RHIMP